MSDSPTLTSLLKPLLLEVMSLLDAPSLKHLRLTSKLLKFISDELITCIKYGIALDDCSPVQLECGAERWPSIKTIKLSFPKHPYRHGQANPEEVTSALECLVRTKWTAVEEINFPKVNPFTFDRAPISISAAQALAACTVSWGRLRKLKMQAILCAQGLDVLATHGYFPLLEDLDLSCYDFKENRTLAGAALAKFASRAPNLWKLKLCHCRLGEYLLPLFETELPNLEIINLGDCGIANHVLSKLNPQKWPGLSTLVLENNPVSAEGLNRLLKENWNALKHLDVSGTPVVYAGIECLIAASLAGRLPSLTSLGVGGVSGISFEAFAFASWPNLEQLVIGGGHFDKDEIVNFISSIQAGRFPSLKSLALTYWKKDFINFIRSMSLSTTWNDIEEMTLDACIRGSEDFAGLAAVARNSFPKLRFLTFRNANKLYYYEDPIDPYIRHQAVKTLLHPPWPSLMRVEFKYYEHMPEALSGWKVTKSDCGNRTVMERI